MFPQWEILTLNIDKQIKLGVTKGDIILIVCVVFLIFALFLSSFMGESSDLRAEIYLDGEKVYEITLGEIEKDYILSVGNCELSIEKDGVSFISSMCRDKLCVKKGKLTKKGDAMACVPEKVVVSLKSEKGKQPDSVTY